MPAHTRPRRQFFIVSILYRATGDFHPPRTVLESSRTSPRPRKSSRTILKSLVLALALRLVCPWLHHCPRILCTGGVERNSGTGRIQRHRSRHDPHLQRKLSTVPGSDHMPSSTLFDRTIPPLKFIKSLMIAFCYVFIKSMYISLKRTH